MKLFAFAVILVFGGCGPSVDTSGPATDPVPEALYPWGSTRASLEEHHAHGKLVWVRDVVPADDFAAATMREMISIRKPRPAAYEVFVTPRLGAGGGTYEDYVFFDDDQTVIYVARRSSSAAAAR
ncbi:MAG TPA: hypothetical protein VH475_18635 [Tepidisphaeraceae bacterium]|jgi:hypothetical protein